MMSSDDPPRLPKWAFLLGDGTLLATAAWIAAKASHPTTDGALVAIVSCVALAAVFGAIPFLADYGRQQEAALVERQRALSALAQTVETCAEQISIAAGSLQRFSEAAVSRAPPAEETAPGLHPTLAELQAQLVRAREAERAKLAQLEAAVTAAAAAVERIGTALTTRIDSASAQLEAKIAAVAEAVATPRPEATHLPEAPRAASSPIAKVVQFEPPVLPPVIALAHGPSHPVPERAPAPAPLTEAPAAPSAEAIPPPAETTLVPPPRKRAPRKAAAPSPLPLELPVEVAPTPSSAPLLAANPVAPAPDKTSGPPPTQPTPATAPPDSASPIIAHPKTIEFDPPSATKPSAEATEPEDEESALSADGATRLLVTAYIGIGNRLFIRGEGPGLTWERGVPLQFVSIGKWRWETAEATAPVAFRLYKNDETECTALGRRTLAPGRQQEFQATF
jgi:hypothetical protein